MRVYRTLRNASKGAAITAHTIHSPTPAFLSSFLASNAASQDSSSAAIYLLSTNLPADTLQTYLSILQTKYPISIGSFTHSSPSISIATFPNATTWRSDLSGRPPVEVGRYYRPRTDQVSEDKKGQEIGEGFDVGGWDGFWEADLQVERIPQLEGRDVQSLVVLGDESPRPVLRSLDAMFPDASVGGMITAGTPFLTGRPHTLLHNSSIYSTGSVGLALPYRLQTRTDFALESMLSPFRIGTARGNMLLTFEGGVNPTQSLVGAIQKRGGTGLTKEEDFYLAFLEKEDIKQVVKILSGDPSRGALSLDTEETLTPGQTVQFMQRKSSILQAPTTRQLLFGALAKSEEDDNRSDTNEPSVQEGFLGMSESGIIVSQGKISICSAPGSGTILS